MGVTSTLQHRTPTDESEHGLIGVRVKILPALLPLCLPRLPTGPKRLGSLEEEICPDWIPVPVAMK